MSAREEVSVFRSANISVHRSVFVRTFSAVTLCSPFFMLAPVTLTTSLS